MASKARAQANLLGSDGKIKATQFGTGSITSDFIEDGSVTTADLADSAVHTDKIQDGAVTAAKLAAGAVTDPTPAVVSDVANTSTGFFSLPTGDSDNQPSAAAGYIRYDTGLEAVTFSDGVGWFKISAATAILNSVTGAIYAGAELTLTLSGQGFLQENLVVNFLQASDAIDVDVTVTPSSDTAATVNVPSSVYDNVTTGNVVSISVTNTDGKTSAAVTKTALALPSGGSITTSGDYRIHTFTSSSSFVVPSGVSLSDVEYVVVAGGGGGGAESTYSNNYGGAGGGGAGGYRSSVTGESSGGNSSAETKLSLSDGSYTVTVGSGGSGGSGNSTGSNGSNSVFATITSTGGGGGGGLNLNGNSGGSGGGGGGAGSSNNNPGSGASGTFGQGTAGSNGNFTNGVSGSGGGGGGAGSSDFDRVGLYSSITGSSVAYSIGGQGISGASNVNGSSGRTNKGDGGQGGALKSGTATGGSGGSGIVIVRYQL